MSEGPPFIPEVMKSTGALSRAALAKSQIVVSDAVTPHIVKVEARGDRSRVTTTLCRACPRGEHGCCAVPPSYWPSDMAMIALTGQVDWFIREIAAGNLLLKDDQGSEVAPAVPNGVCVYWRPGTGCSLDPSQRPPYCNYWICGEALEIVGQVNRPDGWLDGARAVREHLWQRRHWLSRELWRQVKGMAPLVRPGNLKNTRRNLMTLGRMLKPLLDSCMTPDTGAVLEYRGRMQADCS